MLRSQIYRLFNAIELKILLGLAIPLAVYALLALENIKLFFSQTDAFLYLGYAINYTGLQHLWGHTYPASRLSTILPLSLRENLNIPDQIWRSVMISIISLSLYYFLLKKTSPIKAFLTSLVSINFVWIFDHLSDDMNFGYAIIYATIALVTYDLAVSELDTKKRSRLHWIVGLFLALTLNSHFVYLFVFVPLLLTIILFSATERRQTIRDVRDIAIGAFLTYLGILVISIDLTGRTGLANHLSLAKQFIVNSGESGRIWTKPLLYFFPFVVIIILIPLLGIQNYLKDRSRFGKRALAFSVGTLIVGVSSVSYHLIAGGPILSITRYSSIYIPPIVLILAMVLVDLRIRYLILFLTIEAGVLLVTQLAPGWQTSNKLNSLFRLLIILPTLFTLLFFAKFKWLNLMRGFSALSLVAFLPLTQAWGSYSLTTASGASPNGEYREFLSSMSEGTWVDQQHFAESIAKIIKSQIPPTFYGWTIYPGSPTWLGGIDATQLWGYSCYKCLNMQGLPIARTYPPFSQSDVSELRKRDYVLIFDTSKNGLMKTSQSLMQAASEFTPLPIKTLVGQNFVLYYQFFFTNLYR